MRYGWAGRADSMSEVLARTSCTESSRTYLREALLILYVNDEAFREALASCSDIAANASLLELDGIDDDVAQMYIDELGHLRDDAVAAREGDGKLVIGMIAKAIDRDEQMDPMLRSITGGHHVKRVTSLCEFNKHHEELTRYFLSLYGEGKLCACEEAGRPSVLAPATFIGWAGPGSSGQAFAFLPTAFEYGRFEIQCSHGSPFLMEEWCSGIKIAETTESSVIIDRDEASVKPAVPIAGGMVPTASCSKHVAAMEESGEFEILIFFIDKETGTRSLVYSYEFCCK